MSKGAKLGIVVIVAVVALGGGYLAFSGGGSSDEDMENMAGGTKASCPSDATDDPAYRVAVVEAPTMSSKAVTLAVTRDARPVTGANVCVEAGMAGMAHDAVSGDAKELSGGRYRLEQNDFGMEGSWSGMVVIEESGRRAAAVPLTFDVK